MQLVQKWVTVNRAPDSPAMKSKGRGKLSFHFLMRRKSVHFSGAACATDLSGDDQPEDRPALVAPFHAKANRSRSDNGSPELGSEITLG